MAHNYDPVAVYHATIPVPDDGDPAIAASVNSPFEDLADGLAYGVGPMAVGGSIALGGTLTFTGSAVVFDASLQITGGIALIEVDAFLQEDVTLGSSAADSITVNGTLLINNNAQVGSSGTDALDVRSAATFNGTANFISPVECFSSFTINEDGALTCDGGATFNADVEIGSSATSLNVNAPTLFRSSVTIGNDSGTEQLTVNAATNFEDTVEFNGNLQIDGDSNVNGDMIIGGDLTCTNDVTLGNGASDAINLLGSTTITNLVAPLGYSGVGRVGLRTLLGPNSNTTVDLKEVNCVRVDTITATREYSLEESDIQDGDYADFYLATAGAFQLRILNEAGTTTIATLTEGTGCRVVRVSSAWKLMRLA